MRSRQGETGLLDDVGKQYMSQLLLGFLRNYENASDRISPLQLPPRIDVKCKDCVNNEWNILEHDTVPIRVLLKTSMLLSEF